MISAIVGKYSAVRNALPGMRWIGGQGSYEADFSGTKIEVTGPSGMIGLGVDHMRSGSKLGFYGELNYNAVSFDEVTVGGVSAGGFKVDIDYVVLAVGLRFRFQ